MPCFPLLISFCILAPPFVRCWPACRARAGAPPFPCLITHVTQTSLDGCLPLPLLQHQLLDLPDLVPQPLHRRQHRRRRPSSTPLPRRPTPTRRSFPPLPPPPTTNRQHPRPPRPPPSPRQHPLPARLGPLPHRPQQPPQGRAHRGEQAAEPGLQRGGRCDAAAGVGYKGLDGR